jgi:HD-GYP domain-containing protein (c-di-GMP phosphodiesterase class II)
MVEEIRDFDRIVRGLMACIVNAQHYFLDHPIVQGAIEDLRGQIEEILGSGQTELEISLREGQFIHGGRPLFELSHYAHRLIESLDHWGIGTIAFLRGVATHELGCLVEAVCEKPGGRANFQEVANRLRDAGVRHILLRPPRITEELPGLGEELIIPVGIRIPREVFDEAINALDDLFGRARTGAGLKLSRIKAMGGKLADAALDEQQSLLSLASRGYKDSYTYNHSVHCAILAAAFLKHTGAGRETVAKAAEIALLHDVGKMLVPAEILSKPGKLTESEWAVMRQHPEAGARILLDCEGIDDLTVAVAYGHHIKYDGRGYPELPGNAPLPALCALATVIDVYEALTAWRPYRGSMAPEKALSILAEGAGKDFDPMLVRAFTEMIGIFPVGAAVELDTGETGIVTKASTYNPLRPTLKILTDPAGRPLDPPLMVDLDAEAAGEGHRRFVLRSLPSTDNRYIRELDFL